MANAKICDACGKFYKLEDRSNNIITFGEYTNSILIRESSITEKTMDICPECMKKISDFVDSLKGE